MPIKMAPVPVLGLPATQLDKALRVDFEPGLFDELIEIKGYRLVWQRAMFCPCKSNNDQTKQPDPNCPECKGGGWLYFRPAGSVVDLDAIGEMDELQASLVNQPDAVVVRGIMTNFTSKLDPIDKLGHWGEGGTSVTVRFQNKIGYYDKLTNLDSTIAYSEVVTIDAASQATLVPRYPIAEVNQVRSLTTVYDEDDFDVVVGSIVWKPGMAPALDTVVSLHYNCHPVWLVMTHPHAIRSTNVAKKLKVPATPAGTFQKMPIQAVVQYAFLPRA